MINDLEKEKVLGSTIIARRNSSGLIYFWATKGTKAQKRKIGKIYQKSEDGSRGC